MSGSKRARGVGVLVWAGLLGGTVGPAWGQDGAQAEVRAVAEAFLHAITTRDTAAMRSLILPTMPTIAVVDGPDSAIARARSVEEMLASIGRRGPPLLERMWDPEVRVSGPIATVWTPYDFHVDGRFSHCGIDAFQLVRTTDGWKVAATIYTIVRDESGCEESPLGPPEEARDRGTRPPASRLRRVSRFGAGGAGAPPSPPPPAVR